MTNTQLRIALIIAAAAMLVQPGYAVPPTIQFSPVSPISLAASQTTSGGPPMTITCTQPQAAGSSTMISLYIKRVPATGGAETILVYADINNKVPQLGSGVTGMTAYGNLDIRTISGTITKMSCDKAGMYICESTYLTTEGNKDRVTANYTVDVTPGSVEIIYISLTAPSGAGSAQGVGDSVQFTCSANVGSVDSTTRIVFVWEYGTTSFGFPSFVSYPNFEDIDSSQTPAPPTSAACSSQVWKSYLTRNLTLEDSERRYRCSITKNNVPYEDHAGYYTFPIVDDPANPRNPGGSFREITTRNAAATTTTAAATTTTAAATTVTILGIIAVVSTIN